MKFGAFLRVVFGYLRPYQAQTWSIAALLLVELAFTTALPLSFKVLIDWAIVPQNRSVLWLLFGGLLVGVGAATAATIARDYLYASLSATLLHDVRVRIFAHLQRLSMTFHARARIGDIMARFSSDLSSLENVVSSALPITIFCSFSIPLSVALLFALEWHLAVLTVLGLVTCIVSPRLLTQRAAMASYDLKQRDAQLASAVHENLSAQPVVKAFGLEHAAMDAFEAQAMAQAERFHDRLRAEVFMHCACELRVALLQVVADRKSVV